MGGVRFRLQKLWLCPPADTPSRLRLLDDSGAVRYQHVSQSLCSVVCLLLGVALQDGERSAALFESAVILRWEAKHCSVQYLASFNRSEHGRCVL